MAANRTRDFVRTYPLVVLVLLTGVVGGVLELTGNHVAARWLISALALGIAAWLAKGMVDDLRSGTYGIDLLAVVAIISTIVVGEYWAALVVCLMLSGGEALEDYAAARAKRELSALLENTPQEAGRVNPDQSVTRVPIDEIVVGDVIAVRPGELVPTDGTLLSPNATLDESSLTGESLPVNRVAGEPLMSGALNGQQAFTMRASAAAADSQYQRIIELVREAQESRSPFVRLADRVAVPFTAVALLIAGVAWYLSGDPVRFAEVLVVATPCPLIIAAPVAFLAGMSRAAKLGIIVKDSASLEKLAKVRTAAFDKTGTLTSGVPSVSNISAIDGDDHRLLGLAAAVEAHSTHPLAQAIVARAQELEIAIPLATDATEEVAAGIGALVDGQRVLVGKPEFVAPGAKWLRPEPGASAVHVSVDGVYAGLIDLADQIRPETAATLEELHLSGVRNVVMLTGDHTETAQAVGSRLGIDDIRDDLLPADKVAAVKSLTERPVLMVGDGVNDAPVLAAADVGIAMGAKGSAAASESADVVILQDDVFRVPRAIHVGRRTLSVAWQAIAIGVGMSVGLMIIATTGIMPAVVGALMQEVVDLACILWALLAARPGKQERRLPTRPILAAASQVAAKLSA